MRIVLYLLSVLVFITTACTRYTPATSETPPTGEQSREVTSTGHAGTGSMLTHLESIVYTRTLHNHVKSNWHWKQTEETLIAVVEVKIEIDGRISDIKLQKSSGNATFDRTVLATMEKSSPVPTPPVKTYDRFSKVRLTFDSRQP